MSPAGSPSFSGGSALRRIVLPFMATVCPSASSERTAENMGSPLKKTVRLVTSGSPPFTVSSETPEKIALSTDMSRT